MLNHSVHPLFVGTFGIVGVNTSEAVISDSTLSIILQIIIALGTLLKLWNDYRRDEAKRNQSENEN